MSVHNYGSGKIGGGYAQRKRYEGLQVPNILRYERVNKNGQLFMQQQAQPGPCIDRRFHLDSMALRPSR